MPNQAYRLRIRNAADSTDALTVTSIAGGTNPYIAAPPSGDGQEVDLLTGAVRTGAYVVEVVDVITGSDVTGTTRLVTYELADTDGRQQLLSRRAFIEMSSNGGSSWDVWVAGYVTSIRQVDAIRYAVTVSNTRRIEQSKRIFTWQTAAERTAFPKRGCIFGGPVIGGLGGGTIRAIDSGGWEFLYRATTGTSSPVAGDTLALKYDHGYFPPTYERKQVPGPDQTAQFWNNLLPFMEPVAPNADASGADFAALRDKNLYGAPNLTVIVTDPATGNQWLGSLRGIDLAGEQADNNNRHTFVYALPIYVTLYAPETSWPTLPAQNTRLRVRAVTREVSEASPIYLQAHPVDIANAIYGLVNLSVNSALVTSVKAALGDTMLLTARITAATTMADFLETALYGPFGFSARVNASGQMEFFTTRALSSSAPSLTIADADLVGDAPPVIYDLDEATVVTGFTVEQTALAIGTVNDSPFVKRPADGVFATPQPVEYLSGDTSTFSTRIVEYAIPGMVTDAVSFVSAFQALANGIAQEGFDRFGRGAPSSEVQVLRTAAAAAAQVGDFVYLTAGYYPNKKYRIGESTVGARVVQVVRREERPEMVVFKLVDAGPYVQPATAATISIAASTSDPRRVAQFTITNAATLTSGGLNVAVQWATGASTPTGAGQTYRYASAQIPTGAVALPPVVPGTKVWVRARSEWAGRTPSAWTNWVGVTLTAWTAPSSVTMGTLTNQTAVVSSWNLNSNTTDPIDIYVAPGSSAPSDWTPYRVSTLPPGTTTTTLTGLSASTAYIVGVAFRDMVSNIAQAPATATFTTNAGTTGTATAPIGLQVITGVADATLPQGIALALYPAVGAVQTVVERSTTSGSGFSELAVIPADTLFYVDYLPKTSTTYYYRLKHRAPGQADSSATAEVSSTATGVPNPLRPDSVPASLTVNYTTTDATYEITWAVGATDVATVSIDGGAYSTPAASPITVARAPYEGGADKIYTFKSTGVQGDVVTSSVNVARQLPYVSNPANVNITGIVKDSSTSFTTTWTYANLPAGTTFSLTWKVFDVGSGSGTTTGITLGTSPRSYQITTATGLATGSIVRATVTAKDSGGNVIASDTDDVTF